jgi:hypothetical protein
VQRETDPAFKNPPPPPPPGASSTSIGVDRTAPPPNPNTPSSAGTSPKPKRGVTRRASISNTEQNLSAMEVEWRSVHKPLLLGGEMFLRKTTFGTKKVELKLLPDLTTFSYQNVDRHTSAPSTLIQLSLLRQLACKRNSNSFTLNTQHKQYEFACEAPETLTKWRNAIRVAIERNGNPAYLSYLQKQQQSQQQR